MQSQGAASLPLAGRPSLGQRIRDLHCEPPLKGIRGLLEGPCLERALGPRAVGNCEAVPRFPGEAFHPRRHEAAPRAARGEDEMLEYHSDIVGALQVALVLHVPFVLDGCTLDVAHVGGVIINIGTKFVVVPGNCTLYKCTMLPSCYRWVHVPVPGTVLYQFLYIETTVHKGVMNDSRSIPFQIH